MLSGLSASVQAELNAFHANLMGQARLVKAVSAQAFSKARRLFSARAFTLLNERLLALIQASFPTPRWQGLRLVAADGSKVLLPIIENQRRTSREAVAFALFLPGSELTLSAELYSPLVGERQMLFEHLDRLGSADLLLLDRGYPACWLVAVLLSRAIHFCMRVDNEQSFECVKAFRRSGLTESVVTLPAPSADKAQAYDCPTTPLRVRLVRHVSSNGRERILMTSLLDAAVYPAEAFGDLYHQRWRVETTFCRWKHRLHLEHLSGLSWLAAQQDFGAKIVCDNLNQLAILAADGAPHDDDSVHYRINRRYAFSALKRVLTGWLLLTPPSLSDVATMLDDLLDNLCRFKPGRSYPRPSRPKPHKYHAYKPGV